MTPPHPPRPTYIYGGAVRHIARPDYPSGKAVTDIAFCGADGNGPGAVNLRICKRCSVGWFAWLDRLAAEEAETDDEDEDQEEAAS